MMLAGRQAGMLRREKSPRKTEYVRFSHEVHDMNGLVLA